MSVRHPERELKKAFGNFETCVNLVSSALTSAKTKVKKLHDLKEKLESLFYGLDEAHRVFKSEIIEKDAKTEEKFNSVDESTSEPYTVYNDSWMKKQFDHYVNTDELLDEKIDSLEDTVSNNKAGDIALTCVTASHITTELEAEKSSLGQSINTFIDEVNTDGEITFSAAGRMEKFSDKLKVRLEGLKLKSRQADNDVREGINDFCNLENAKLDSALLQICKKVPDQEPNVSTPAVGTPLVTGREQVHLEKSKPPKFKGDEIEYPEFKRKWLSTVSKANLPAESEVDKLRDAIPSDARDQLYGITETAAAWLILDKRYGDKKIISMKLKTQLKSIQAEGKTDPARVISLAIKVRTLVNKLETVGMSDALKHDAEFLSAVFCALPDKHQYRWLEFEKSECHWDDMLRFLEKSYDMAVEEQALLLTYKSDQEKKKSTSGGKAFAANVTGVNNVADSDSEKEKARKKSEDFCGKCPLCSNLHTWVRKDGTKWPSDRFLSCKKFNDQNVVTRAKTVEKSKGCPRCLSWNHARDKCRMPENKCSKDLGGGNKCTGDHSKLLCGSGNAYCFAAKAKQNVLPRVVDSYTDMHLVNEYAETVCYFQDIPVNGYNELARTFWDEGSNRVLIREEFGEALGLPKKKIKYSLEAVGQEPISRTGYIYMLGLVDMKGNVHQIWGYSIDRIMLSSVPDLLHLQTVFPHVPIKAFEAMAEKEVDLLIGLNMNHIMPEGGLESTKLEGFL